MTPPEAEEIFRQFFKSLESTIEPVSDLPRLPKETCLLTYLFPIWVFCLQVTPHVCSALGSQKRTAYPLRLELPMVASHQVGCRNQDRALWKSSNHFKPGSHLSSLSLLLFVCLVQRGFLGQTATLGHLVLLLFSI